MPVEKNDQPVYKILEQLARKRNPQSYLEIGVQEGDSLRTVLNAGNIRIVALCDTWGTEYGGTGRGNHDHILELLGRYPNLGCVVFMDGDSKIEMPKLEMKFDMILVDGDHSMLGCLTDMENAWKLLAHGGIMVIDDITHPAHLYLEECVDGFATEKDAIYLHRVKKGHGVAVLEKL